MSFTQMSSGDFPDVSGFGNPGLLARLLPPQSTMPPAPPALVETATEPATAEPAEKFCITDEGGANWYLKKLAENEAEQARVKAQAAARIAELKSDAERLTFLFGGQFETWARAEADRRRRRTVTLLQGSVSFRTVGARFSFRQGSEADEEAFVHARTAFPDCIVTAAPKLDKAAYLAQAEATGEALPGLEVVPERESVSVKFGGKEQKEAETDAA